MVLKSEPRDTSMTVGIVFGLDYVVDQIASSDTCCWCVPCTSGWA